MRHRIQAFRKEKGLSQAQLAEKAGISEISIRKYENGERNPKIETLGKIAMALNVPVSDLYDLGPLQPNDFKIPPGKIKVGPEGHEMFVDPIEFQRAFNGVVQKCCQMCIRDRLQAVHSSCSSPHSINARTAAPGHRRRPNSTPQASASPWYASVPFRVS